MQADSAINSTTTQPMTPGPDAARLSGKVAIVTGSSQGIGAGIAERLAAEGAAVVINYSRDAKPAEATVARITGRGGRATAIRASITSKADIDALVSATIGTYGRLDILVNNAGVYKVDSIDSMSAASFDEHFDLNVKGLALMTQAAVQVLPTGSVIVNISSGLGSRPRPMVHVYSATKAAVNALTRTFADELGPRGIRVVGIAPGFVNTEGNAVSAKDAAPYLIANTPLARAGEPADIAAAVAFAVSSDAAWVTGTTIDVAGGMIF